jgi:hypothetical protein
MPWRTASPASCASASPSDALCVVSSGRQGKSECEARRIAMHCRCCSDSLGLRLRVPEEGGSVAARGAYWGSQSKGWRDMRSFIHLAVSLVASSALAGAVVSPAFADSSKRMRVEPERVTRTDMVKALPSAEKRAFESLTDGQELLTLQVLADPEFGIPGREASVQTRFPDVKVSTVESPTNQAQQESSLASGTRTTWVRQSWTLLGITYATVQTTASYSYSDARAYNVQSCAGTYTNLIPGRQISNYSTSSNNSDGTITCRSNWRLIRFGVQIDEGAQGFRVNGYGTIVRRWNV